MLREVPTKGGVGQEIRMGLSAHTLQDRINMSREGLSLPLSPSKISSICRIRHLLKPWVYKIASLSSNFEPSLIICVQLTFELDLFIPKEYTTFI